MQHINSLPKLPLLTFKNEIHLSLSRDEPTGPVLHDQSAAFSTIDCTSLFNCLKSWFGVFDMALKWFMSYLGDCKQLKLGQHSLNCMSCCLKFYSSVLVPLLFFLYTTPLSKVIGMHPTSTFMQTTPRWLFICLIKMQPWL